MTDVAEKAMNIMVLGGIVVVGYIALTRGWLDALFKPSTGSGSGSQPQVGSVCDGLNGLPRQLCELGAYVGGAGPVITPAAPAPEPPRDVHGCRTDIQHWCPSEGICKDIAQACVQIVKPGECQPWQKVVNNHCTDDPTKNDLRCQSMGKRWDEQLKLCYVPAPADIPVVPTSDKCRLRDGSGYLTVPQGMNCEQALNTMCSRFGGHDPRYC